MQPLYEFKLRPKNRVYNYLNATLEELKRALNISHPIPSPQLPKIKLLATQSGADDPVITYEENDTDAVITMERETNGFYFINSDLPIFEQGKVLINNTVVTTFTDAYAAPVILRFCDSAGYYATLKAQRNSDTSLTIFFLDENGNLPVEWSSSILALTDNPLYLEITLLP
jgi:hypothetical protein